jgi:NADPH:quinone reductase
VQPNPKQLAQMLTLLRIDEAQICINREFELADGALAHTAIEAGHTRGKLLLRMPAASVDD